MRISHIEVDGFKSLVGFKMDLSKLTCLIGLNGSGKSTVLQFLDFLGRLMHGNLVGWLDERGWDRGYGANSARKTIRFSVRLVEDDDNWFADWEGTYDADTFACTDETISTVTQSFVNRGRQYRIGPTDGRDEMTTLTFDYEGSLLSQFRSDWIHEDFLRLRTFFRSLHSLDRLSPESILTRTEAGRDKLGSGGQNLAEFVARLSPEKRSEIVRSLQKIYPRLTSVDSVAISAGRYRLSVDETYDRGSPTVLRTDARHMSDGMLRMLAITTELTTEHQIVLFDEIENGINPEVIEIVLKRLIEAKQQIVVTTHSPMILNYLEDETAKQSVIYIYKTSEGHTKSIRFFDIPSMRENLAIMGPGEVFADTRLSELQERIEAIAIPVSV